MDADFKFDWRDFFGQSYIEQTIDVKPNGDIVFGGILTTLDYYGRLESFTWSDNVTVTLG